MKKWIDSIIDEKILLLEEVKNGDYSKKLIEASKMMSDAIKGNNKVLVAGNGGSACDAQHLVGELVGRFMLDRKAMPAVSLGVDSAVVTSISNDYGYEEVFARQVSGLGNKGDVFVGITTSGNSENIVRAVTAAKEKGMYTVGLLGCGGGKLASSCDVALIVPSNNVARIQEIHTFSVHVLCENIEKTLFG